MSLDNLSYLDLSMGGTSFGKYHRDRNLKARKWEGISSFLKDHVQEDTSGAKRVSAVVYRAGSGCL